MFDRTQRTSFFSTSNVNPGPGHYDTVPSFRNYKEENVPFRFKVGHTPIWSSSVSPAPNTYTIKYRKNRIKGAPWSKFTEKKPFASYIATLEEDDGVNLNHIKTITEYNNSYYWEHDFKEPKICKGNPYKGLYRGIKSPKKVEIKDLNLKRFYKKSYKLPGSDCKGCAKYRGSTWSKYRSARFKTNLDDNGPGPAAYDVDGPGPSGQVRWLDEIRFYKKATARVDRFTEVIECEELVKDGPSPAEILVSPDIWKKKSFNVKGTFGNPPRKCKTPLEKLNLQQRSLWKSVEPELSIQFSKDPRDTAKVEKPQFTVVQIKCPKPKRDILPKKRLMKSRKPFEKHDQQLPGPADYNPPQGTVWFKLCKKQHSMFAGFVAPFGTTGIQRPNMVDREIPDPASYDLSVKPRIVPYGAKISTFTARDNSAKKSTSAGDSLMYNAAIAFDALTKRRDHCKNPKPFNSTGPRLAPDYKSETPAPSTYAFDDSAVKFNGGTAIDMSLMSFKKAERINNNPGPGSYDIHPLYKDAMVKAHCSHNISLGPCSDFYPFKPRYGPPLPKKILKTFVKYAK